MMNEGSLRRGSIGRVDESAHGTSTHTDEVGVGMGARHVVVGECGSRPTQRCRWQGMWEGREKPITVVVLWACRVSKCPDDRA